MGGVEEKINEWFSVVREKSGGMTRAAKVIDEWLMEKIPRSRPASLPSASFHSS